MPGDLAPIRESEQQAAEPGAAGIAGMDRQSAHGHERIRGPVHIAPRTALRQPLLEGVRGAGEVAQCPAEAAEPHGGLSAQSGVTAAGLVKIRRAHCRVGNVEGREEDRAFGHFAAPHGHFALSSGSGVASQIWMGLMGVGPDC